MSLAIPLKNSSTFLIAGLHISHSVANQKAPKTTWEINSNAIKNGISDMVTWKPMVGLIVTA